MLRFSDLDSRIVRERVDMAQVWSGWIEAEDLRRHSFPGYLGWEMRRGREYLYRRTHGRSRSLGPRSAETEITHKAFHEGRAALDARLASLSGEIDRQAAVLRALDAGRLPVVAARVLRALRAHAPKATLRVVGTNALYAYEALAGVVFDAASTTTGDVDLLVDDRNRLRLLAEGDEPIGIEGLVRRHVDASFRQRRPGDVRLTNDKGCMIEFIRPEPRPAYRPMPGAAPIEPGDVAPAPIAGLQWLVHAPAIEAMVLDARGYPVTMRCPDPRVWAAHKLWLAGREDRHPEKALRDRAQGEATLRLIAQRLPQMPLDAAFRATLPKALGNALPASPAAPVRTTPDW